MVKRVDRSIENPWDSRCSSTHSKMKARIQRLEREIEGSSSHQYLVLSGLASLVAAVYMAWIYKLGKGF